MKSKYLLNTIIIDYLNTVLNIIYFPYFVEYFVSYGFLKSAVLQFKD
jgi:hypothetical protein